MPYIKPHLRANLSTVENVNPVDAGELNYCLTRIVQRFLSGGSGGAESYARYNSAVGALECAKLELYRRKVAPYEDRKIAENGDVYL
jgi:hypothetical protein